MIYAFSETALGKSIAPKPGGFTMAELAAKVRDLLPDSALTYTTRHAAYDFSKFRGKKFVEKIENSRRYRTLPDGIRVLVGMLRSFNFGK